MLSKQILAALVAFALITAACKSTTRISPPAQEPVSNAASTQISGEEIYHRMGCAECHEKAAGVLAPSLVGLYGAEVLLEGGEAILADENYLRESILSPSSKIVRGYQAIMPDFKSQITDDKVEALVDYIRSMAE